MVCEQENSKEIGGYIELWQNTGPMLHEGALALNCGKTALAYLLEACGIKKIMLPRFLCHSMRDVCLRYGTDVRYYSIRSDFLPLGGG